MYTIEQLSDELSRVYNRLITLVEQQADLEFLMRNAQECLTWARACILTQSDAKSLGCNEAQREAEIIKRTLNERRIVEELEGRKINMRASIEIARLRVEAARAQLRLLEMAATTAKDNA